MEVQESDQVIRRMMHDLRASIRALRDLPAWIKEDVATAGISLPDITLESLDLLSENAVRLDQYMVDIHGYARAGGARPDGQVDVAAAWSGLMPDLDLPETVQIDLDFQTPILPVDPGDFTSVLRILVENAMRHHHRATQHILIKTSGVSLMVADDGPGIAPEFRERVFGFLEKLASQNDTPGSGIGLATARRLCDGHGGGIHVEPSGLGGACFVARFG